MVCAMRTICKCKQLSKLHHDSTISYCYTDTHLTIANKPWKPPTTQQLRNTQNTSDSYNRPDSAPSSTALRKQNGTRRNSNAVTRLATENNYATRKSRSSTERVSLWASCILWRRGTWTVINIALLAVCYHTIPDPINENHFYTCRKTSHFIASNNSRVTL